ncbi:MAG: antibiotic biosynthesis monooxygenase family protein [Bacteroidota bacterium]
MAKIITLTGQMEVRPEKEKEFTIIMQEAIASIHRQKGCLSYRFYQHVGQHHTYCFIGMWKTPMDAKASFQTDEFAILLKAFDLLRQPPEIRYHRVLYPDGLKVIRLLRNHSGKDWEEREADQPGSREGS